jgi:stage IV sporulation protein FB
VLLDPGRTPYDMNFGIFGFRVRIHPYFWLCTGLFSLHLLRGTYPEFWFIWMAIVLVSILVHELGHAFAFRLFGCRAYIVLYAFGGLAISNYVLRSRFRRILISLAGPFAGFVLAGLLYLSNDLTGWGEFQLHRPHRWFLYTNLLYVNFFWGLLNLLPVFPLDGGQVAREFCEWRWPGRGERLSLRTSIWVAVAIAVYSFICAVEKRADKLHFINEIPWYLRGTPYIGILFLFLAYINYQLLQRFGRGMYYEAPDDRLPWER